MSASSPAGKSCVKCGAPLPADAPKGICPRCELHGVLELLPGGGDTVAISEQGGVEASGSHAANALTPSLSHPVGEGGRRPGEGRRFGNYELLEEIARGGMGVVYRARQVNLDRIVAVKMILSGQFAAKQFVQRFRAEAAAAAVLQHPNIVAVHDVGVEDGQHYFSMDFVEGQNLAQQVGQRPLPPAKAARYVKLIAAAIHYAHEQGILHRDLKPSNVLIDANDQPRVTDFGLAKRLTSDSQLSTHDSQLTQTGQVLGSPNFMPPEQASADRGKVGRASDVYGLGAILYFLLTARAPFQAESLEAIVTQVLNVEPISPRLLNPASPRDLETICLKCLEKESVKRYPTAQALAEELGRFLNHEPILARPVSRIERAWRWCRRRPAIATLSAAAVLIFLLGFAGVTWQGQRASKAAAETKEQRDVAQGRLYAAQMKLAHAAFKAGNGGGALRLLQSLIPGPGQPDFRGFDWRFLYRLCQSSQSEVLSTNASGFAALDWSSDGRTVALGAGDGVVELFDGQTRQRLKRWQAHEGSVNNVLFCPQDTNWLVTLGGDDGWLKLWDLARQHAIITTNGSKGMFTSLAFSPSGTRLVASAPDTRSLNLWELQRGSPGQTPRLTLRTNLAYFGPAAFSPDEQTLAVCNDTAAAAAPLYVTLCDVNGRKIATLPTEHANIIQAVAFSRDGRRLATGGVDARVVVWDREQRQAIHSLKTNLIVAASVAFSADGQSLYVGSLDVNLRLWNFTKKNEILSMRGHSAGASAIALSPDGPLLASAGRDGTARVWSRPNDTVSYDLPDEFNTLLHSEDTRGPEPGQVGVNAFARSPDPGKIVVIEFTKLRICDLTTSATLTSVSVEEVFKGAPTQFGVTASAAVSPDGRTVAVGSLKGNLAFLDAVTLRPLREPRHLHEAQLSHVAYGLNGTVLVTGGGFGTDVVISEAATGKVLTNIVALEGSIPVQPLAVSADGKLLATASPEQRVRVWDLASRRVIASSPLKVRVLNSLAFSPDGQWLAIGDELGTIFLWDHRTQHPLRKLEGHLGPVLTLAFSPDSRTLASSSMDHTIKLWHPDIDQEVATLTGHSEWVWTVVFAEGGNTLISGSLDGTMKVWRALSLAEIEAAEKHPK